jgi:hypothetical protein
MPVFIGYYAIRAGLVIRITPDFTLDFKLS